MSRLRASRILSRGIRTQARYEYSRYDASDTSRGMGPHATPFPALVTPRQVHTCICLLSMLELDAMASS
jgi:hypothetical protein